jgi:long-subunit fatty acid transport protein
MRQNCIFVALAVLLLGTALFGQTKTGTSTGQFLLIEPSARIAGMGNAGVTGAGDVEAAYYNPAAIALLGGNAVQFTHSAWIADITYDYAAVGVPLGNAGTFFANVTELNSGEIDVRTVQQPLGTGEHYTVTDLAFGIGYARKISDRFSVGMQLTYLQETIWHSSLNAYAMNVGTLYRISENGLALGASISNFGTRAKYDGYDLRVLYDQNPSAFGDNGTLPAALVTDDYPLPILFRVGLGMPVEISDKTRLRLSVDAYHPNDNNESVSMGAEWEYNDIFFVRAGYQNLFLQDSEVGLTLGTGLRYDIDDYTIDFDYAWSNEGRLPDSHRFTLGFSF